MNRGSGLRAAIVVLALAGGVAKLFLLVWVLSTTRAHAQPAPAWQQGRAIFLGEQALHARVSSSQPLPAAASRCINCHAAPGLRPAADRSGAAFGPVLDSARLLRLQARRGGPPSRYDADSLCRVLREGIDPAGVMLPAAMPRYRLDDAQCRQLWALLTSDL